MSIVVVMLAMKIYLMQKAAGELEEEMVLETVNLNGTLEESIASIYNALVERGIVPVIQIPEEPVIRVKL